MKNNNEILLTEAPSESEFFKILAIIAHNVKGPIKYMQYITDYTINNWETMQPSALLGCAEVINESSRNIDRLLSNLLSWARIQEGSLSSQVHLEDLNTIVAEELRLYEPFFRLKNVVQKQDLGDSIPIYTDKNLFSIVFQNILSNALKFAPKNSTIEVSIEKNQELGQIAVFVTDQGEGIDPDVIALLCNNEVMISPGTSEEIGTGYGLKISQYIMHILDGHLSFHSEKGKNTRVGIHLPY